MIDLNSWHPMPRYGVAAALVRQGESGLEHPADRAVLWELAKEVLPQMLDYMLLGKNQTADLETISYQPLRRKDLNPGKAGGQISETGFYIAPHILSSQNAADVKKEAESLEAVLDKEDKESNYELKKSFAPMIAKINAGKKSMSNPKIDVLKAAFTAIATMTELKPAAFIYGDTHNAGIIPDLLFFDAENDEYPLIDFIEVFKEIQSHGAGHRAFIKKVKDGKYQRPDIFNGNFENALPTFGLGSLSLIAAIGKWTLELEEIYGKASSTVEHLAGRPIYIVSYGGTQQERFGHHLINLTMTGELHEIIKKTLRVDLIGIPSETKFSNPKWQLFLRSCDHFLRFFDRSTWQNFLMHRATYPIEFFHLFKTYFMNTGKYTDELIESAVAYGRSLNRAAYLAGKENAGTGASSKAVTEAKQKVMLQLESIIQSAETNQELAARLNAQVGRLTFQDIDSRASLFLKEVMNNKIEQEEAKHLITAFMRLSSYDPNEQRADRLEIEETEAV